MFTDAIAAMPAEYVTRDDIIERSAHFQLLTKSVHYWQLINKADPGIWNGERGAGLFFSPKFAFILVGWEGEVYLFASYWPTLCKCPKPSPLNLHVVDTNTGVQVFLLG